MGGGFGLTKAFLVTKQFGGRMWIKSELGVGTRITLKLPRPGSATPA
jgi:signal transduction histidine kinase